MAPETKQLVKELGFVVAFWVLLLGQAARSPITPTDSTPSLYTSNCESSHDKRLLTAKDSQSRLI